MKKYITTTLSVILIVTLFSNCASIVSKSSWPLSVTTSPVGASVEITEKNGLVVFKGNSPATVLLKSGAGFFGKQSYQIKLNLAGFEEKIIPVECKLNGWYFGNIVFGGLIGLLIVDPATGAMFKLDRNFVHETLAPTIASSNEPSLRILSINEISENMKQHLVSIDMD